jgi:protein gp37
MMSDAYWLQPLAWERQAVRAERRDRVFCASMADVFEDRRQLDAPRGRLWRLIDATPHLDWLLLTKRPQHVARIAPWRSAWPKNVWLGTTVETQRWVETRLPHLLSHPAAVHFLSCEPLLGPLDLAPWLSPAHGARRVGWVIAGGESGHRARPMNPAWARGIRDQCATYDVPFHFKQWGNWRPAAGNMEGRDVRMLQARSGPIAMVRLNKKLSGRTLDGEVWDGLPAVA